MDNLDNFRDEVKTRLKALNNPSLAAAFAIRAGLRVLPILACGVDEGQEFLWFWKKRDRTQHLLALLQAYNAACFFVIDPSAVIAIRAFAIGEAAIQAADTICADASAVAAAAIHAFAVTRAAATQAIEPAADHAARVAVYAIYASAHTDALIDLFRRELKILTKSSNSSRYLQTDLRYSLPSSVTHFYSGFIFQLRKARVEGFDYWANWLEARWQGRAFDIEHLKQSVLLDESIILNPRWLTYGVYTLLYSKQLERQAGQLREQEVPDILQAQKVIDNLGNVLKYPHDKCRFIIDAMVQFQLCYRTDQNKKYGYHYWYKTTTISCNCVFK
ncbi:MAG: hypothetical protein HC877_19925 [Thioploca sp.]|nr:hypothetical protein [Thioploca sp.]